MKRVALDLATLRETNVVRCEQAFHKTVDEWTPERWALAMCGEAGEVANAVKKLIRGDGSVDAIADEIADVIIYADLLACRLGIDLSTAIVGKFNEVSEKRGCPVMLVLANTREAKLLNIVRSLVDPDPETPLSMMLQMLEVMPIPAEERPRLIEAVKVLMEYEG